MQERGRTQNQHSSKSPVRCPWCQRTRSACCSKPPRKPETAIRSRQAGTYRGTISSQLGQLRQAKNDGIAEGNRLGRGHRRLGRWMRQNGIPVVRTDKHKVTTSAITSSTSPKTCWIVPSPPTRPTRNGPVTSAMFGPKRDGFILR
jgi:hypothetical protein